MAKTNFTKVEEALNEGMRKIEVNRLLVVADENAAAAKKSGEEQPEGAEPGEAKPAMASKVDPANVQRLTWVHSELKALDKLGEQPYVRLGIDKDEIKKFVKDSGALTEADWEKVKAFKEQILAYKKERNVPGAPENDDDLITQQRKSQKTKRFNINNKWIPLR